MTESSIASNIISPEHSVSSPNRSISINRSSSVANQQSLILTERLLDNAEAERQKLEKSMILNFEEIKTLKAKNEELEVQEMEYETIFDQEEREFEGRIDSYKISVAEQNDELEMLEDEVIATEEILDEKEAENEQLGKLIEELNNKVKEEISEVKDLNARILSAKDEITRKEEEKLQVEEENDKEKLENQLLQEKLENFTQRLQECLSEKDGLLAASKSSASNHKKFALGIMGVIFIAFAFNIAILWYEK